MENVVKRIVVGFDLRKASSLNNLYMTSYDEDARYEDIYDEFQDCINGLNLFYLEPSAIDQLDMPEDARVIAFDLPDDVVQFLLEGNVSPPYPLPKIELQNVWDFIGFDVVDPMTQTSAFHGFTPPIFVEHIIEDDSFNNHGLLSDFEAALKVANFCSVKIPEHAPFSPCGIWLKQASQ